MATRKSKSPDVGATRYIPCQAEPGMFRGEFLVYAEGMDLRAPGEKIRVQLLVDEREVANLSGQPRRNNPAPGMLRVTVAGVQNGIGEIILPQAAQPVGERMLVDVNDLREESRA